MCTVETAGESDIARSQAGGVAGREKIDRERT